MNKNILNRQILINHLNIRIIVNKIIRNFFTNLRIEEMLRSRLINNFHSVIDISSFYDRFRLLLENCRIVVFFS